MGVNAMIEVRPGVSGHGGLNLIVWCWDLVVVFKQGSDIRIRV